MTSKDRPGIPAGQEWEWFRDRYELAAGQIIGFLSEDFITLEGRAVADIGCGDGIIDLGLAVRARPAKLVGFDIRPTDAGRLRELAAEYGASPNLPEALEFRTCWPQRLPAPDACFDVAVSWSAFQHLQSPLSMIQEIRRILRPGGTLMIHLYPFFHSQHGSMLEPWFPEGFAQFHLTREQICSAVRANPGPDPEWAEAMLKASLHLNRLNIDELGRFLRLGRFSVRRIHLIGEDTKVPVEAAGLPLSHLGTAGVRILAEAV